MPLNSNPSNHYYDFCDCVFTFASPTLVSLTIASCLIFQKSSTLVLLEWGPSLLIHTARWPASQENATPKWIDSQGLGINISLVAFVERIWGLWCQQPVAAGEEIEMRDLSIDGLDHSTVSEKSDMRVHNCVFPLLIITYMERHFLFRSQWQLTQWTKLSLGSWLTDKKISVSLVI